MAEIVNLRLARKQRDRERAALDAAANRARFGRTRAEREAETRNQARHDAVLDGSRLQAEDNEPNDPVVG